MVRWTNPSGKSTGEVIKTVVFSSCSSTSRINVIPTSSISANGSSSSNSLGARAHRFSRRTLLTLTTHKRLHITHAHFSAAHSAWHEHTNNLAGVRKQRNLTWLHAMNR